MSHSSYLCYKHTANIFSNYPPIPDIDVCVIGGNYACNKFILEAHSELFHKIFSIHPLMRKVTFPSVTHEEFKVIYELTLKGYCQVESNADITQKYFETIRKFHMKTRKFILDTCFTHILFTALLNPPQPQYTIVSCNKAQWTQRRLHNAPEARLRAAALNVTSALSRLCSVRKKWKCKALTRKLYQVSMRNR